MASETVEDIVREMRGEVEWKRGKVLLSNVATEFANRIAAAHKREMENRALIAGVSLAEGYEATHKQKVGELKKRLDAIVKYAKEDKWLPSGIVNEEFKNHHRLHNISMKKIIDLAKGEIK